MKRLWPWALILLVGCGTYSAAKPWADAVCDVVHALPEASAARLPADRVVTVHASSASVAVTVEAPPAASASGRTLRTIDVGY